jgi:hypothetical protein
LETTTEKELTFSFEDDETGERFSDVRIGSVMELDRLSQDSAKAKNAAYFRQMKEVSRLPLSIGDSPLSPLCLS